MQEFYILQRLTRANEANLLTGTFKISNTPTAYDHASNLEQYMHISKLLMSE